MAVWALKTVDSPFLHKENISSNFNLKEIEEKPDTCKISFTVNLTLIFIFICKLFICFTLYSDTMSVQEFVSQGLVDLIGFTEHCIVDMQGHSLELETGVQNYWARGLGAA